MIWLFEGRPVGDRPITITWLNVSAQGMVVDDETAPTRLKKQCACLGPNGHSYSFGVEDKQDLITEPSVEPLPQLAPGVPIRVHARHRAQSPHTLKTIAQNPQ